MQTSASDLDECDHTFLQYWLDSDPNEPPTSSSTSEVSLYRWQNAMLVSSYSSTRQHQHSWATLRDTQNTTMMQPVHNTRVMNNVPNRRYSSPSYSSHNNNDYLLVRRLYEARRRNYTCMPYFRALQVFQGAGAGAREQGNLVPDRPRVDPCMQVTNSFTATHSQTRGALASQGHLFARNEASSYRWAVLPSIQRLPPFNRYRQANNTGEPAKQTQDNKWNVWHQWLGKREANTPEPYDPAEVLPKPLSKFRKNTSSASSTTSESELHTANNGLQIITNRYIICMPTTEEQTIASSNGHFNSAAAATTSQTQMDLVQMREKASENELEQQRRCLSEDCNEQAEPVSMLGENNNVQAKQSGDEESEEQVSQMEMAEKKEQDATSAASLDIEEPKGDWSNESSDEHRSQLSPLINQVEFSTCDDGQQTSEPESLTASPHSANTNASSSSSGMGSEPTQDQTQHQTQDQERAVQAKPELEIDSETSDFHESSKSIDSLSPSEVVISQRESKEEPIVSSDSQLSLDTAECSATSSITTAPKTKVVRSRRGSLRGDGSIGSELAIGVRTRSAASVEQQSLVGQRKQRSNAKAVQMETTKQRLLRLSKRRASQPSKPAKRQTRSNRSK